MIMFVCDIACAIAKVVSLKGENFSKFSFNLKSFVGNFLML